MVKILLQTLQPPKIKKENSENNFSRTERNGGKTGRFYIKVLYPKIFMRKQLSPTRKPITNAYKRTS